MDLAQTIDYDYRVHLNVISAIEFVASARVFLANLSVAGIGFGTILNVTVIYFCEFRLCGGLNY